MDTEGLIKREMWLALCDAGGDGSDEANERRYATMRPHLAVQGDQVVVLDKNGAVRTRPGITGEEQPIPLRILIEELNAAGPPGWRWKPASSSRMRR